MSNWHDLHRPKSFKSFFGNERIIEKIKLLLSINNPPSTWLISGPISSGKTTLARLIAGDLLNVDLNFHLDQHPDYDEINVAAERSIEKIRQLLESVRYLPRNGRYKVIVLDECHALLAASASVLLKILESPPKHIIFILCTSEEEKVLKSIRNRCKHIRLEPMAVEDIVDMLERIIRIEKLDFISEKIVREIAERYVYHTPREAIDLLNDLSMYKGKKFSSETLSKKIKEEYFKFDIMQGAKILSAIYDLDTKEVCALVFKVDDIGYMVNCLLDLNEFLLWHKAKVFTYLSEPRKQLLRSVVKSKYTKDTDLSIVQVLLKNWKKEITFTNISNPKQISVGYVYEIICSLREQEK
jgi:DNA polymerase III subunit gamma/tau